ncbi:MAG: 50S ribosomal protein L5 [Candidatus Nanoarchaeia archaeon]|nr:50S ribosomal protein L5 [Candidatus Nanoarchaeia archaeon]MDD5053995.1 50S ribosomal protein L5 [Candidatus Nanoarchaeia archaeon]MDD5499789.1 50S ribosomal protein L5 [Candidatus Nanoarchaeia archaeon]
MAEKKANEMKNIMIEKLTLNIGVGEAGDKLEKAYSLLKTLSGKTPIKTVSHKRIPKWNVRPGIAIGVKVTMRKDYDELLKRLLLSREYSLKKSCFDNYGNVSFGVDEYVHIPGVKYDPKMPMFGLNATITLKRKGYRIKDRRLKTEKIPKNHRVSQNEAIDFIKNKYEVKIA